MSACVTDPPRATLPLFIHHYYGNKDSIHELDRIQSMPFLCQSLFGHGATPPFWCQREWRTAADFAVTCSPRQAPCWLIPSWKAIDPPALGGTTSPNEVLGVPSKITDGFALNADIDVPMAAPIGAEMEQEDTAVPLNSEVIHIYSTGLNGSLCHDMPDDQTAATFHLRGAYGPSLSQMFADADGQAGTNGLLPRAPLRSHADYIEFCRCLLDEEGHQCWRDILGELGVGDQRLWVQYVPDLPLYRPSLPNCRCLVHDLLSLVSSLL